MQYIDLYILLYRPYLLCRYVLKSQMKELLELEAKNAISIEEEIENERKKVDAKTPITEEVLPAVTHAVIGSDQA